MIAQCVGPGCSQSFEAKTSRARFCSSACRGRAHRQHSPTPAEATVTIEESNLTRVVRRELEEIGQIDGVDGQLALVIAAQLSTDNVSGFAALSAELRALLARARTLADAGPVPDEDVVAVARRARDEKRAALGLDPRGRP